MVGYRPYMLIMSTLEYLDEIGMIIVSLIKLLLAKSVVQGFETGKFHPGQIGVQCLYMNHFMPLVEDFFIEYEL